MLGFDTNVLIRVVVADDPSQTVAAGAVLHEAARQGGAWISQVVIVEVVWVLSSRYRFERARVCECLLDLLDTPVLVFEERDRVERALAAYSVGAADFSDYLVLESARDAGALPLVSFDARLAREADVRLP